MTKRDSKSANQQMERQSSTTHHASRVTHHPSPITHHSSRITLHPISFLQSPNNLLRSHPGLLLAILIYLILALSYFFIVPIFEGPDEWTHTGHVKFIAEGNGLPVMLPGQGIWGGQQPPLYYALGALLVQPFELDGVEDYQENHRNPHASIGYALDPGNKNNYLHRPSERFPYRGLSLTVHLLRLYSMVYGIVALVFIYLTAFEIYDSRRSALWAFSIYEITPSNRKSKFANPKSFAAFVALFVACQPMFAFITVSVANEPANIAFSAIGLWLAQRYVRYGPSQHWGRAAALGVTLGLISLSKMTGLSFGLVAVVAMLIATISTRKEPGTARLLWRDGVIIGVLFLTIGGWWYWRNYQLYGDFFQEGLYEIYFNDTPDPLTLSDFLYTLSTGEVSFWATFGWLNIAAPEWVYSIYRIISRVGLLGVALGFVAQLGQQISKWANEPSSKSANGQIGKSANGEATQNPKPKTQNSQFTIHYSQFTIHNPLILHLLFPVTLAFSLTRLVAIEGGLQGRQLLPALGSIAIVIVWGWWFLSPPRLRMSLLTVLLTGLLGLAIWLPYGVVAPAYIPKPFLTEADLPAELSPLNWIYGNNEIMLIGVEIGADVIRPGERVPVTAYWQALKPMETDYSVFVHLKGRGYTNVGQLNSYPGLGLRPTSTLQPGQIIIDTYPVQVNGGSQAPTRLLVNIGLFKFDEPGRPGIPPTAAAGSPVASPTVGQLKLIPTEWPSYEITETTIEFADHIWLVDYSIDNCRAPNDSCRITFRWLGQGRPVTDYTVFIQLWRNGQFIGFDSPPLANDYPTGLWDHEEVILDPHPLDLSAVPPGDYQVLAGLYNFTTGERLPATAAGQALPDYAVDLGVIQVK